MATTSTRPIRLPKAALRALTEALERDLPRLADRLEGAKLYEVVQPFFRHFRLIEVQSTIPRPPVQGWVAARADGSVVVISESLPHWNQVIVEEPVSGLDDDQRVATFAFNVDWWTTASRVPEFVIQAFDEIFFYPKRTPEHEAEIARLRAELGAAVTPRRVEATPGGWDVVFWVVSNRRLVRRTLRVSRRGEVERDDEVRAEAMPVHPGKLLDFVDGRAVPVG